MKISNREWAVVIFWFGILSLIAAVLLMSGCSHTKQVLKSATATEKVAMEYLKRNPQRSDTQFLPGKIIRSDTTIYDTIPLPYPVKERYTEQHFKEVLIRDTLKIIDRSFQELLTKRVDALEVSFKQMEKEKNEWKREAWVHRSIWIAIIIFFAARLFIRVIRPLLKAYFKI